MIRVVEIKKTNYKYIHVVIAKYFLKIQTHWTCVTDPAYSMNSVM